MRNVPLAGRRGREDDRPRHAGLLRGRPAQPGQRGALTAARQNRRMVTHRDFEDAKDKVMMGAERKSMVMTEDEKRMTAYHEGGHALLALSVPNTDPVHKATIIPRGRALGMVMQLPERDKLSMSYQQMTSRLVILFGGRVAEEIIFGKEHVTSGASSDIEQATRLARMMVTKWGYSDLLGQVSYGENQDEVFLGTRCRAPRTSRKRPPASSTPRSAASSRRGTTKPSAFSPNVWTTSTSSRPP
jgi:cell division protease FtsH